jgi:ferritin
VIHDDLVGPINDQITSEAYASQLYLQMSMWAEDKGLPGTSRFFRGHVAEEMDHRNRLVDYMVECDAPVRLQAIPAPTAEFDSLVSIINAAYEHEKLVTDQIDSLASLALDRRDFNTFTMLQWFIAEQREELVLFRGIVDYMKLAGFTGVPGDALVNLDRFLLSQCEAH